MPVSPALRASNSHSAERRVFRYPLEPCPKIAVICDTLHVPAGYLRFPERERVDPRALRIETVAAPASLLMTFPSDWTPSFPLVAFTGVRHGFLDDEDRERLWRKFGVPVFEQLLDDEGRVLARECEAHSGLHVDPRVHHEMSDGEVLVNGRPSGITVREATGLCGCGGFGPRLLDAGPATSAFTRLPLESVHDKTSDSCGPADDKRDCLRSGAGQI